jgi:hypothetical protein
VLHNAELAMRARLDDVLARVDDPAAVSRSMTALGHGLDLRRAERRAAIERA